MAVVEVDETELLNMRNITGAMQRMLANPKTRPAILRAQKLLNPDAVIPELDATEGFSNELTSLREETQKTRQMIEEDKADREKQKNLDALTRQWESGRVRARKAGYTLEGLEALEKFMEERGVADHEIAIPAFERINPPAAPVDASQGGFNVFTRDFKKDDDMKLLLEGNEQQFLNKRVKDTLNEIRGR